MTADPHKSGNALSQVKPGLVPTDDDLYWVGTMRTIIVDTIRSGHTAALMIIVASMAGWIIVAAALVFDVAPGAWRSSAGLAVWLLPLIGWSGSIFWALRVFSVRRYRYFANSPDSARQAILRIARRKARELKWAIGFWSAGLFLFVVALFYSIAGV